MKNQNIKFLAKCFVGCGLFFVIFYSVDWRASIGLMSNLSLFPTISALLLIPLGYLISSYRWKLLLAAHQIHRPLFALWKIYWIGSYANNFLPTSVGGDAVRLGLLTKLGCNAQVASSIVVERLTGFVALVGLTATALLFSPAFFHQTTILQALLLVVFLSSFALVLFWGCGGLLVDKLNNMKYADNVGVGLYLNKLRKFLCALVLYRDSKKVLCLNILLAVFFYALVVVIHLLCLNALQLMVPFLGVLAVVPAIIMISFLPLSINAIGLAEGATVLLYSHLGLLAEQALAVALLIRILQLISSLPGGLLWIPQKTVLDNLKMKG